MKEKSPEDIFDTQPWMNVITDPYQVIAELLASSEVEPATQAAEIKMTLDAANGWKAVASKV